MVADKWSVRKIARHLQIGRHTLPKYIETPARESMRHSFVLLAVHYAIIRAMLIGMAALHKDNLSTQHVVKLVRESACHLPPTMGRLFAQTLGREK
jgi:hypothetical protein